MGNQLVTEAIEQAKEEHDGVCLFVEGSKVKAKGKELQAVLKKLSGDLPNLVEITAKGFKLKQLPNNVFAEYPALEVFNAGDNKLDKLPSEFKGANVIELYLPQNAFKEFPFEVLAAMPQLAVLDMSQNLLTSVPEPKSTQFQALRKLNLEENHFSEFPCEVCSFPNLRTLIMSNNKLPDLPLDIGRLVHLEELIVKGNRFEELPVSLRQLKKLRVLDCSDNQLTELPDDLAYHKLLERLEAQHNQIPEIPKVVCQLTNLTHLRLHGNQIKVIPSEIGSLTRLSELNLKENEIGELPASIGQCAALRKLFLEYNQIRSIPKEVANLKKLLILILHHNSITTIPEELKDMRQLMRFSLNANPLDEETLEVMKSGGALALLKPLEIGDGNYSTGTMAGMGTYRRGAARRSTLGSEDDTAPAKPVVAPGQKVKPTGIQKGDVNSAQLQQAFATLLEREDFSSKKKHVLNKLSDDQKWELMEQYAGSTLELMKNRPGLQKKKSKKPMKDYPKLIREGRANRNVFSQLIKLLKENADNYLTTFVNGGGITAIVTWLKAVLRKETLTIRDVTTMLECLGTLYTLTQLSCRSVITTTDCVNVVSECTRHEKLRTRAVEVLEQISESLPQVGPAMVLESFASSSSSSQAAESAGGDGDGATFAFQTLVDELREGKPDDLVVALSLTNGLIESIDDLVERYKLRSDFNNAGVVALLSAIKSDHPNNDLLQFQRERYEEELRQDYEDMMCTHDKRAVLAMSNSMVLVKENLAEGQVRVTATVYMLNLHDQFSEVVQRSDTVGALLEQMAAKHGFKAKEYALYAHGGPSGGADRMLAEPAPLSACECTDAQLRQLECRMTPWPCTIQMPDGQKVSHLLDPLETVQAAVRGFVEKHPMPDELEYSLFIPGRQEGTFRYLDEMKAICETSLKKRKYRETVFLRPRPITVRVKLSQDLFQQMVFDAEWQVERILSEIASHVSEGSVSINIDEYHLVLQNGETGEKQALELGRLLSSYKVTEHSAVVLCKLADSENSVSETDVDEEEDVNIWDEPADSPENITFDGPAQIENLETATLNKLVERVTSTSEFDTAFMNSFLSMFHSFCTPTRLWQKLMQRWNAPAHVNSETRQQLSYRVCVFIKNWVDRETIEEPVKSQMEEFVAKELSNTENLQIFASAITKALSSPKASDQVHISEKPPAPLLPKNLGPDQGLTFFVVEELEVARQLTLLTYDIYSKIRPEEFFNQNWSKEKTKHLSPNLNNLVKLFNDVTSWVASSVVLERQVRNRAKLLARFITIAQHLRDLNNFHMLMAFISAFSTSAIGRLKFTEARLPKRSRQQLADLEESMSMQSAFSVYRRMLADSKPPCIPYIGVYLTDLTFMGDGNPDIIDGRINYGKHKLVFSVIRTIATYQKMPYNFVEVWSIKEFLVSQPQLSEADLYKQSLIIEPRGADRGQIK